MVFVQQHLPDRTEWTVDGRLVASAAVVHGLWKIVDRRGRAVVTLMPLADDGQTGDVGLVGDEARLLGTVSGPGHDGRSATLVDGAGNALLVRRWDSSTIAHIVDPRGEVVAVVSTSDNTTVSDVLVTSHGSGQPLSMLFGLLLATDGARAPNRPA